MTTKPQLLQLRFCLRAISILLLFGDWRLTISPLSESKFPGNGLGKGLFLFLYLLEATECCCVKLAHRRVDFSELAEPRS